MYVIKSGSIFEVSNGNEAEFVSPFAEEVFIQDSRSWEQESWKFKEADETDPAGGIFPRSMLWGGKAKLTKPARVKAAYLASAVDRLYYVLEMPNSAGLFYYDLRRDLEIRLFHKTDFQPRGLFVADDYSILTTVSNADGTIHLLQLDGDGKREKILTSGDCIDENPSQHGRTICYQSSGLARGTQGNVVATSPTAIFSLDLDTGDVDTLLSSEKHDYLLPRVAADGALYVIQTPYQGVRRGYPVIARLVDIVMFPWRLAVAIFAFLNVFSVFFAKKPLTMAGGPNPAEIDVSRRILHNRVINVQETMRREGRKVAVSRDWKLVRHANGRTTEIASNVLWYELDSDGSPVYTDGYGVFGSSGKQLECDELVSSLTIVPMTSPATAR